VLCNFFKSDIRPWNQYVLPVPLFSSTRAWSTFPVECDQTPFLWWITRVWLETCQWNTYCSTCLCKTNVMVCCSFLFDISWTKYFDFYDDLVTLSKFSKDHIGLQKIIESWIDIPRDVYWYGACGGMPIQDSMNFRGSIWCVLKFWD
jgi:hypothetical protein